MVLFAQSGCKKFLDITPVDNLAGNAFWKTQQDVESFVSGMYGKFRRATLINTRFFVVTGDFRCAPLSVNSEHNSTYQYITFLRNNALGTYLSNGTSRPEALKLTIWNDFYATIQLANILYRKTTEMPAGVLSAEQVKAYQAEAVFMRCMTYFFLVRQYGDVPYYTNAYNEKALPRTNMVEVLNKCIAELQTVKNDLPWTYENSALIAVRAMRGSVIALMMDMNLWAAGFDRVKAAEYYEKVATLGKEAMEESNGAYTLLPLSRTKEIFSGGSKEGIFEVVQNINGSEQFSNASIYSNYTVARPYLNYVNPIMYYDVNFIRKIYPPASFDGRQAIWFDINLYNGNSQQMIKFLNPYSSTGTDNTVQSSNIGNQMVYRYADIVLMRAEALAELEKYGEALPVINLIRKRAEAAEFATTGQALKDDIYWERVRELMGEGHYFYDLVRTRKLVDGNYAFAPISLSAYNSGGWTWPIDATALTNNPFMTLNQYWN